MNPTTATPARLATNIKLSDLPSQPGLTIPSASRCWLLQLQFAFQRERWSLIFIVIGLLVLTLLAAFFSSWQPPATLFAPADLSKNLTEWFSRIQDLVGFLTLGVAVVVWHGELREDWEQSLPKQMSVFLFGSAPKTQSSRPVIVSRNVWLAGEDDLRQWGMQVASQAVTTFVTVSNPGQLRFDFGPDIFAEEGQILLDSAGRAHKHYTIRFNLTRLPDPLLELVQDPNSPNCLYQNLATKPTELLLVPVEQIEIALREQPDWTDANKQRD